jgi:hypothetical protein
MKKSNFCTIILLVVTCSLYQSCATLVDGQIQSSQKHKPENGEPRRKLKVFPLIAGIVTAPFGVGIVSLAVDFSTKAIYKPTKPTQEIK